MKFYSNSKVIIVLLFFIVLAFVACGRGEEATPTIQVEVADTAIPTAEPTAIPPTPKPTNTPEPTNTPKPPEKPEVVASFDAERGELPEGIAIDNDGNIYVSLGPPGFVGGGLGEIWKISPDGDDNDIGSIRERYARRRISRGRIRQRLLRLSFR